MRPFQLAAVMTLAAGCLLAGGAGVVQGEEPSPTIGHSKAHAHNDYVHERPLLDALANGFRSVEADIFLIGDELLVAHSVLEISPNRTLRGLYLDPLRKRMNSHSGTSELEPQDGQSFRSIEGDGQPMTLLIDLKSDGPSTYRALHQLLSQYDDVFTHVTSNGVQRRGVTAIVSGNRPFADIEADLPRFVGIDGRLGDLDSDMPSDLMPLISDHWGRNFKWRGKGELPEVDRAKLAKILARAHSRNRRVRFWATPDHRDAWKALNDAGVDLINTDDLQGLNLFLTEEKKENTR